jgi:AraC-like DNA-binding protein
MDAHLDDSHFGVSELANALLMERSTLFKRLKRLRQESPVQLLRNYRLDAAATLLPNNIAQVTEVAYACGFESLSYFSRVFRERFGQITA